MKPYFSKQYLQTQLKNKRYLDIARENNVSSKTIQRWMTRFSLTKRRMNWTEEEVKLLKREYYINQNLRKLFPEKTEYSIYHKASRLKLVKTKRKAKYKVNSNFFKTWSPEMAYILGWFFSDGNVSSNLKVCSFHISKKDKEILYKIRRILGSTHPIEIKDKYVYFRINDRIVCSDLIKYGCVPRKSLKLKFPRIPNKYVGHFIRGYFDGDGSIGINHPNTIKISFLGTKNFILSLQGLISRKFKIKPHKIRQIHKACPIYQCSYYGNDARKLFSWMYKDSNKLFLKRKKIIYDKHIKNWSKTYGL